MSKDAHDENPRPRRQHRLQPVLALLMIAVAAIALAACGSSSGSNTTTNGASTTKASGGGSSRFASLRACLAKEGITLPSGPSNGATGSTGSTGSTGQGGFPGARGGFKLPEGVSRQKFQEALKKCGGGAGFGGGRNFNGAATKTALTKYATCMRENGVKLPAPNTSGKGPVFDTKGIDTTSAAFKNAQKKCQSDLPAFFGPGGGNPPGGGEGGPPAGGPPNEGGAPPGEGGAPPGEGGAPPGEGA
ncbi:MAG TPA: hypothetical protein VLZ06_09950 [Solirubrobacteraceae bacterium]|nr:hypothetical protein [Solirubrobacteraceae bacterium]